MDIMRCPNPLPPKLGDAIAGFAQAWAASVIRPRVSDSTRRGWAALLDAWIADKRVPLFVRRASAGRGQVVKHVSGRELIPTDNSPAHWALALALQDKVPTLAEVSGWFEQDLIPVAMVLKRAERKQARYRCTRSSVSLNALGWKVSHLDEVGLGRATPSAAPLEQIHAHFRRFLSPGNMFLVPLQWSGIAEIPQMVAAIRAFDAT